MNRLPSPSARALWTLLTLSALALSGGCETMEDASGDGTNPALRPLQLPPNATAADKQRAALSRLVGVWTFSGWTGGADDAPARAPDVSGIAAGVVEDEFFVLLDLDVTSGELSGRSARKDGSMLFASEPEIGATVTAWGDGSPSMSRLVGVIENHGATFRYTERRTPPGRNRVTLTIEFVTDDHWLAEIRDAEVAPHPLIARYEFERLVQ